MWSKTEYRLMSNGVTSFTEAKKEEDDGKILI
jgi:hypothetical protein